MSNLLVLPRQLAMASGAFAPNTLYFYEPGTSTPKAVYDVDGDSLGTSVAADANGRYPAIYGDGLYKVVEQTSAGVTVWTADNVAGFETGSGNGSLRTDLASTASGKGASLVGLTQGGTVQDAVPWAGLNAFASVAAAFAALNDSTIDKLYIPHGNHSVTADAVITRDSVTVHFEGDGARLVAGANNVKLLHIAASNVTISGRGTLSGNGYTGVYGLLIGPEDLTQTTTLTYNNYNTVELSQILSCAEGVALQCGPDVGGTDSQGFYNSISVSNIRYCTRGIWFRDPPNASGASPNRNKIWNTRIGETGCNTGIQIDAGDTNRFISVDFEGIQSGTSPNTTPTAVKIVNTSSVSGASNESNTFVACKFEANTRDLENANAFTEFYGCNLNIGGSKLLLTADPLVMMGGYDASNTPQIMPGYKYQTNSQLSGVPNTAMFIPGGIQFDNADTRLSEYKVSTWTPVIAGSSTAGTQTYSVQTGFYVRIGSFVIVQGSITMTAKDGTTAGNIYITGLPFTSSASVGSEGSMQVGFLGNLTLDAGKTWLTGYIPINSTRIEIAQNGSGVAASNLPAANLAANFQIVFTATYLVD